MVMPYLLFSGNCEEAFLLYQRAFDGQAPALARYGDAPEEAYPHLKGDEKNKIMHGQIMLTETGGVSGADAMWPVEKGTAICVHVFCKSVAMAEQACAVLAEGGTVVGPIAPNPPPHDNGVSGMIKDQYGICWILSAQIDSEK